jgi:hypothetical protein
MLLATFKGSSRISIDAYTLTAAFKPSATRHRRRRRQSIWSSQSQSISRDKVDIASHLAHESNQSYLERLAAALQVCSTKKVCNQLVIFKM